MLYIPARAGCLYQSVSGPYTRPFCFSISNHYGLLYQTISFQYTKPKWLYIPSGFLPPHEGLKKTRGLHRRRDNRFMKSLKKMSYRCNTRTCFFNEKNYLLILWLYMRSMIVFQHPYQKGNKSKYQYQVKAIPQPSDDWEMVSS